MLDKPLAEKTLVMCLLRGDPNASSRRRWIIFTNKVNPHPMLLEDYTWCIGNDWIRKTSWKNLLHDYFVNDRVRGYFKSEINYDYKLVCDIRCVKFLRNNGYRIIDINRKGKYNFNTRQNYKVNFTKQNEMPNQTKPRPIVSEETQKKADGIWKKILQKRIKKN